ncbi:MAG TPA: hypothetical protein VNA57_13680 [Acidimicrobiales bacterium]|nr:hypothetical protein [Acidimicrobiales bacterium]
MFGTYRRVLVLAGLLALSPGLVDAAGAGARRQRSTSVSAPSWAPASQASVHPGVETVTKGGQCTANFVFTDAAGAVYLGQAAHCSGTGGPTETDGCDSASHPLGTPVEVEGASRPGILAYNSWLTMQARGERDPDACAYNDFALVKLDPADIGKVNPSVPFFGGPTGLSTSSTRVGETVYSYGSSSLRLGLSPLSPKRGISIGDVGAGWSHLVYTVSPGIPGDSGSAFLDSNGEALGVLSTLQLLPLAASNGVGDLRLELAYLNAHSGLPTVTLALGTKAFRTNRLL